MISHISGIIDHIDGSQIVIDVNGVGYAVAVPSSVFSAKPKAGDSIKLYTYQVVREDAHSLFGFSTKEEKRLFSTLLSVNGVGPKAGLSIISEIPLSKLVTAIAEGNSNLISSVKGIGKKTAEKVVIELKEKVAKAYSVEPTQNVQMREDSMMKDAVSALMTLGYSTSEARKAIEEAEKNLSREAGLEEIIKTALGSLI